MKNLFTTLAIALALFFVSLYIFYPPLIDSAEQRKDSLEVVIAEYNKVQIEAAVREQALRDSIESVQVQLKNVQDKIKKLREDHEKNKPVVHLLTVDDIQRYMSERYGSDSVPAKVDTSKSNSRP